SRQSIYLVRFQRTFLAERHSAIDVIPYRRCVRRMDPHHVGTPDTRRETRRLLTGYGSSAVGFDQLRSTATRSCCTVACCTLLSVERCSFFSRSAAWRQFFSVRTDGDVQGADFFCCWSLS